MKSTLHFFFFLLSLSLSAQSTNLYPFFEQGHWGFIYEDGSPAIRPRFHSVGAFSHGLAPARPGGLYGYIDESGDFFLEPRYEYAEPFREGVAIVYLEAGHPVLIDRTGSVLFEHDYPSLERRDEPNRLLAITETGQQALLDYQGRVVIDTFYREISELVNGHYVVHPTEESFADAGGEGAYRSDAGLLDADGQVVIPFGLYYDFDPFGTEHWLVYPYPGEEDEKYPPRLVLNSKGERLFTWPKQWERTYELEGFNNSGLAPMGVRLFDRDTVEDGWLCYDRERYATIVNEQGEQLFMDKGYDKIIPFAAKRFFARDTNDQWRIINPSGKVLTEQGFMDLCYSSEGLNPWIIGRSVEEDYRVFHPQQKSFLLPTLPVEGYQDLRVIGNWVYFTDEVYQRKMDTYQQQVFVLDLDGERKWSPGWQAVERESLQEEGLLVVILVNGNSAYLNDDFSIVYESQATSTPGAFNVDYQMRAYCYAGQKPDDPPSGLGGNARSKNVYQSLPPAREHQRAAKLEIIQEPDLTFNDKARGIRLRIANYLTDTLVFPAQDSRIELVIQAQDQKGTWRDIEYLPSSWCGNSYHQVVLPPNSYWNFIIPQYTGALKTQLRAKVNFFRGAEKQVIYSDPYQASVNPAQFWRRLAYSPRGLMDPYDN